MVAGTGPGPFTGLRVGLVTAAALADALAIPAYGVCSLDGLAVRAGGEHGRVLAVTDARRREVYWAAYADGVRIAGPAVDRPADLAGRVADLGVEVACGAGARQYAERARAAGHRPGLAGPGRRWPGSPPTGCGPGRRPTR